MVRYGVDRDRAVKQLTPVLTPDQSREYTARRKKGLLRWEPGRPRGWEPTRRPRNLRRRPGTTPKARARTLWKRRARLEERRRERAEEREDRRDGWAY